MQIRQCYECLLGMSMEANEEIISKIRGKRGNLKHCFVNNFVINVSNMYLTYHCK